MSGVHDRRDSSPLLECGLLWATQKGDHKKVAELLADCPAGSSGIRCDIVDHNGLAPLHYAARDGDAAMVRLLLAGGASAGVVTRDNHYSALHCAVLHRDTTDNHTDKHLKVLELLVHGGCPLHLLDNTNKTVLHYLALTGCQEALRLVIGGGAAVDVRDGSGWTPLLWAAYEGRVEAVTVLLAAGASTHLTEADSWTALHWASCHADVAVVTALLNAGASPHMQDNEGYTPLYTAAVADHSKNTLTVMELLIQAGADMNKSGSIGWTPLHRAASNDTAEVTELLLQYGANPDEQNISGDTPLHIATVGGRLCTVQALIDCGASLTIQDLEWKTPLHKAIERLDAAIICPFLGAGVVCKLKVRDIENCVIETFAGATVRGNQAALVLSLLHDAGVISYTVARRLMAMCEERSHTVTVPHLTTLVRLSIQHHLRAHNTNTVAHTGLPIFLQKYLLYKV